jgi:hypothetical protein
MFKTRSSIEAWLSQRDPTKTRKRRRDDDSEAGDDHVRGGNHSDLPSPATTLCPAKPSKSPPMHELTAPCATPVWSGKRRKDTAVGIEGGTDDEDDPTPHRREDIWGQSVARSIGSQSSTHTTSESTDSQTSSVKRRRRAQGLGLVAVGAPQLAYFGDDYRKPPPLLHDLAVELEDLDDDKHFVWPELRDEIAHHPLQDSLFRRLAKPVWFPQPGSSSLPPTGPRPSCAQLQQLVETARECETEHDSEAHWNCAVHYPVLAFALTSHSTRLRPLNCTSATINADYQALLQPPPPSSLRGDAKKVDFCIVIRQSGVDRHPAIADINTSESINHSNHPPLLSNPIVISIETKAASPNQEEAELQMGVWMTAHFARLRALVVRQCDRRRPGLSSSERGSSVLDADTKWRQAIDELGFLPGLLVLQHEWYFVAATWAPPRPLGSSGNDGASGVTLWRRIGIGSTATPEGICHIIHVVRRLALWAETVYWPWFRRWALDDIAPCPPTSSADTWPYVGPRMWPYPAPPPPPHYGKLSSKSA